MKSEEQDVVTWANVFPLMEAFPTRDSRVFQTKWTKEGDLMSNGTKTKKFFCCTTQGVCYGVDVTRNFGVNAAKECETARFRVMSAAMFYEKNKEWPKE